MKGSRFLVQFRCSYHQTCIPFIQAQKFPSDDKTQNDDLLKFLLMSGMKHAPWQEYVTIQVKEKNGKNQEKNFDIILK